MKLIRPNLFIFNTIIITILISYSCQAQIKRIRRFNTDIGKYTVTRFPITPLILKMENNTMTLNLGSDSSAIDHITLYAFAYFTEKLKNSDSIIIINYTDGSFDHFVKFYADDSIKFVQYELESGDLSNLINKKVKNINTLGGVSFVQFNKLFFSDFVKSVYNDQPAYTSEQFFNIASEKADAKDYEGAIEYYSKCIEMEPNLKEAYHNRALAKCNLKDYGGAILDHDKSIVLDSNNLVFYYNRGRAKSFYKDYEGAIADNTKVLEMDPNFALAYLNRGLARIQLNKKKNGCSDLYKAKELVLPKTKDANSIQDAINEYCQCGHKQRFILFKKYFHK